MGRCLLPDAQRCLLQLQVLCLCLRHDAISIPTVLSSLPALHHLVMYATAVAVGPYKLQSPQPSAVASQLQTLALLDCILRQPVTDLDGLAQLSQLT